MKIYLVGVEWFSSDQGNWSNTQEFPEYVFVDVEEAEKKYLELSKDDSKWSFGYQKAYLVEAETGKDTMKRVHGSLCQYPHIR